MNETSNLLKWKPQVTLAHEMTVVSDDPNMPWLVLTYPAPDIKNHPIRAYECCEQVAAFLNGGDRPRWLSDLDRTSDDRAEGSDGTTITAMGPRRIFDPVGQGWISDPETYGAERKAIMDLLLTAER